MKKIITLLTALILTIPSFAKTDSYMATRFNSAIILGSGQRVWDEWSSCRIPVTVSEDNIITIYSVEKQVYYLYQSFTNNEFVPDFQGGKYCAYLAQDFTGVRCKVTLRVDPDGFVQLYIEYSNITLVYNLE